jgi:hypothetical protein
LYLHHSHRLVLRQICRQTLQARQRPHSFFCMRETSQRLIPITSVDIDTSLGAFANKFIRDHSGDAAITGKGGRLTRGEVLQLKKQFHTLYDLCLQQIDVRFPPDNMHCFKLMQVLDPTVVHVPLRRNKIGEDDLTLVVANLVRIFEVPLYASGCACFP